MLPHGFEILGFQLSAYGLTAALGAFLAWLLLVWLNDRQAQPLSDGWAFALCLMFYAAFYLGAMLLGLLTLCISDMSLVSGFSGSPLELFVLVLTNKSLYGGLILSLGLSPLFARIMRRGTGDVLSLLVPLIPFLLFFGRLGCFMSGCCYGVEAPWGICFPAGGAAPHGIPLVPTQLISAVAQLLLFLLIFALRRLDGERLCLLYLGLYAPLRFVLEFWRGDAVALGPLSFSQWISLLLLVWVLAAFRQKVRAHAR